MLDLVVSGAEQVGVDPDQEESDDHSLTSPSHDSDGLSDSDGDSEFEWLPESSGSPFYDGLDQRSKDAFDSTIIKSKSKSLLSSEEYKYYCSVLKEPDDAPLDVPNFYSEKERFAFHRKRSNIRKSYRIEGDLLCFIPTSGPTKIVASHDNAFHLLALAHRPETTHFSKSKMFPIVSANVHGLTRDDVEDFIAVCTVCGSKREKSNLTENPDKNIAEEPFDRLQLDFVDQYHQPSSGFTWILAIRDHLSNYCQLYPLKTKCPSDVADCLDIFIRYFGSPGVIQHSGDHIFKCAIAQLLCLRGLDLTIGRTRSSIVESSSDEFTEKVQLKVAACVIESGNSCWDESIEQIATSLNFESYPMLPSFNAYKAAFGTERAKKLREIADNSPADQLSLDVTRVQLNFRERRPLSEVSRGSLPACVSNLLSSLPQESSEEIEPSVTIVALLRRADENGRLMEQINNYQLIVRDTMARKYAYHHRIYAFKMDEFCTVKLPREVRSGLDEQRFYGKIVAIHDEKVVMYSVLSKWGVLDRRVVTQNLNPVSQEMTEDLNKYFSDAPRHKKVSMGAIGAKNSTSELKPVHCSCPGKQCNTNRCKCYKAKLTCSQYCAHECLNQGTILEGTLIGIVPIDISLTGVN